MSGPTLEPTPDRTGAVPSRSVPIRNGSIRLGQFLKLADLVDAGADAKPLLAQRRVLVNGEVETRRGRQLFSGDVVTRLSAAGQAEASARVG